MISIRELMAHELRHYIQALNKGRANFQAKGICEQFLDYFIGSGVYNWKNRVIIIKNRKINIIVITLY